MSAPQNGTGPYYFVPQPSHWPITGSCALLLMAFGAAFWFNAYAAGPWLVLAGFCVLVAMMVGVPTAVPIAKPPLTMVAPLLEVHLPGLGIYHLPK